MWIQCTNCQKCANEKSNDDTSLGYVCPNCRIRSSSERHLLYQTASQHLNRSTKGIFARPAAAPSFQPRFPAHIPAISRTRNREVQ